MALNPPAAPGLPLPPLPLPPFDYFPSEYGTGYITYAPRTFSYCPIVTANSFQRGFDACDRLADGTYQGYSGPSSYNLSDAFANRSFLFFVENSVSYNYSLSSIRLPLAIQQNDPDNILCGQFYFPLSNITEEGLSCVQQVRLAPYILLGGNDDSFYTCTVEAIRRATWPDSNSQKQQVVVVGLLIAIYFLIPSLAVLLTCFLSSRWGDPIAHKGEKRLNHGPEYTLKDEAHSSKVTTVAADAPDADPNGGAHAAASAGAGGIELESGQAAIHRSRIDTSLDDKRPAVSPDAEAAAAVRGVEKGGSVHGGQAGRVYLSFSEVFYSVKLNASARKIAVKELKSRGVAKRDYPAYWDMKRILKGCSGVFAPGGLSAIMGPSGCGKSTLLDVLADRKNTGNTAGSVLLNGEPRGKLFKRATGYVMQSDALFEYLTVREMLMYTADLRIEGFDAAEKATIVNGVLKDLGLRRVADSRIGGANVRGISGGQARRCTVGIELVTQPSVLFLDEPTTGLDAYSSLLLVRSLRALADSGRTVLCTIHQPRPDIFSLFDTLLLLSAGEVAFFGPRANIASYLGTLAISIPPDVNPADFVVDLTYSHETNSVVEQLVKGWNGSTDGMQMSALVRQLEQRSLPGLGSTYRCVETCFGTHGVASGSFARSMRWQIYILMDRSYVNLFRSPDFWRRIWLVPLLQYLFFGLVYVGTRYKTPYVAPGFTEADVELDNFSLLVRQKRSFYFQVMATAILTETSVMAEAHEEQRAFRREHAAGAYSVGAYHLQWFFRLNFRSLYRSVVFGSVVYFFPEQAPNEFDSQAGVFFFFLLVLCTCSTVGNGLAMLFISLIPDAEGAAGAHNAVSAVLLQYSGFYLLPCLMPPLVNTAYFISFGKYAFEAMLLNEFGTVPYGTEWNLYNSNLQSLDPTLTRWTNLLVLMVYPLIFHALAILASFLQTRPKSFWAPLEDCLHKHLRKSFERRENLAHADPNYRVSAQHEGPNFSGQRVYQTQM